jgi:hypothetical protein
MVGVRIMLSQTLTVDPRSDDWRRSSMFDAIFPGVTGWTRCSSARLPLRIPSLRLLVREQNIGALNNVHAADRATFTDDAPLGGACVAYRGSIDHHTGMPRQHSTRG